MCSTSTDAQYWKIWKMFLSTWLWKTINIHNCLNKLQIMVWRTIFDHGIIGPVFLNDTLTSVHQSLSNNFSNSYNVWKYIIKGMGLKCMQQMQCWMFSVSTSITKLYLIYFLHISDMGSPGQHTLQWVFLREWVYRKKWHTIQELKQKNVNSCNQH